MKKWFRSGAVLIFALILICCVVPLSVNAASGRMYIEAIRARDLASLPYHDTYTMSNLGEYPSYYFLTPTSSVRDFCVYEIRYSENPTLQNYDVGPLLTSRSRLDSPILLKMDVACGILPKYGISYVDSDGIERFYIIRERDGYDYGDPVVLNAFVPYSAYVNNPFLIQPLEKMPYYTKADTNSSCSGYLNKGSIYTIVEIRNGMGRLKSGAGWVNLRSYSYDIYEEPIPVSSEAMPNTSEYPNVPFLVQLTYSLDYYSTPSWYATINGTAKPGVYTITEVRGDWGCLKSGAGWLYLAGDNGMSIYR